MDIAAGKLLPVKKRKRNTWKRVKKNWLVYLLILIPVASVLIFNYVPMLGVLMAFNKYQMTKGFLGIFTSPWVGFANFNRLFTSLNFWQVLGNTLIFSLYGIIFIFPAPILFALLLNEMRGKWFKRAVQTITYLPNFFSGPVILGLFLAVFSAQYGVLNAVIGSLGGSTQNFQANPGLFRTLIVGLRMWQNTGFGAIIYLAAITGIDQEQFESARLDGANRFRQIWHITIPGIMPTIVMLLIFQIGSILNSQFFDLIFLLYSPPTYPTGDIIGTYVYRQGILQMSYSYTTAVGLFQSAVGLILVIGANQFAKRVGQRGVF